MMSQVIRPMTQISSTTAWRLWVDRCGGFGLLVGNRLTVGGARPDGTADIQVRSDWRRLEGVLERREGDYFWSSVDAMDSAEELVGAQGCVPISGSAALWLAKPSPLSASAVLTLDPPHRFDHHVDKVLLVDQTVLIGPTQGDHIRSGAETSSVVLVVRDGIWRAKLKSKNEQQGLAASRPKSQFVDLVPGRRTSLGELDMMLEKV